MKHHTLFIPPEQALAILLTYVDLSISEKEKASKLVALITDWQAYFDICQSNKVAPINYYQLLKIDAWDKLPKAVQLQFEAEAQKIKGQNEKRITAAKQFLQAFIDEGIPVAIIKGSAFGPIIHGNPNYKRMNDIDILIRKEDRNKIYAIYDSLGYFPLGERISGDREKSDKMSHLAPHYVNRELTCVIGTQWGIKTAMGSIKIDYESIWSRMRPMDYFGLPLQMMSPEDNLHHLCLHLGFFKIALRDMMDIYNIPRFYGKDFDWEFFLQIVQASNSHNVAYHALTIAHRLHPQFEVWEAAKRLEPQVSRRYRKSVQKKISSIDLLLNMFSDQIQSVDLAISRFDMTEKPSEKWQAFLNAWKTILLPPRNEAIRIGLLVQPNRWQIFKARLLAPFRILSVVADEVGWQLVFLLSVKTFVALIMCFASNPFRKPEEIYDWRRYAEDLGLSLEQLNKLEKHFQ